MATFLERFKIEQDSGLDPANPPPSSTAQEITAARALKSRIRSAALDIATTLISVTPIPEKGPAREAILWGRTVIASPDFVAEQMLRLLLAKFDAQTPTQILNPVAVTDEMLATQITELVPALATGPR